MASLWIQLGRKNFTRGVALKKEFQLCYASSINGLRELNDRFISLMHKFRDESSGESLNELLH